MPLIDKEYPNSTEMKQLSFNPIIFLVYLVFLLISQFIFYKRFKIKQPFGLWSIFSQIENETSIIFTFPQFQPRSHFRDKNKFKFVGSSFNETIRFNGSNSLIEIELKIKAIISTGDA